MLNSRQWSGKTIAQHKADRATVVRETLLSAGIDAPDLDRMAATVTLADGSPRFVWTDTRPDHDTYVKVILQSVAERQRWRVQYEAAKATVAGGAGLWTVFRQSASHHDQQAAPGRPTAPLGRPHLGLTR